MRMSTSSAKGLGRACSAIVCTTWTGAAPLTPARLRQFLHGSPFACAAWSRGWTTAKTSALNRNSASATASNDRKVVDRDARRSRVRNVTVFARLGGLSTNRPTLTADSRDVQNARHFPRFRLLGKVLPDRAAIVGQWRTLVERLGSLPKLLQTPSEVETARSSLKDYIRQVRVDRHGVGPCRPVSAKVGSGGRIRTYDLRVMSPTSYQAAPPRTG
jgi:hypothetical protein